MKRPIEERFWEKVDTSLGHGPNGDCWIWLAGKVKGYGVIGLGSKLIYAHRYSYRLHYGLVPDKLGVLHKCDNPACVNPNHLFLGNQKDNVRDMMNKGRQNYVIPVGSKHGCAKLHEVHIPEIRKRLSLGESQSSIARDFNVDKSTIHLISKNKIWTHV